MSINNWHCSFTLHFMQKRLKRLANSDEMADEDTWATRTISVN